MDRETLESLKDDMIGDPLEGYLFGKPVIVCTFKLDHIMYMPGLHSVVSEPHDVLKGWWDEVVSAAKRDQHDTR